MSTSSVIFVNTDISCIPLESQKSPYTPLWHWLIDIDRDVAVNNNAMHHWAVEHCCNTEFRVALDYRKLSQTAGAVKEDTLEVNRSLVSPKKFLSPRAPFIVSSPIWNGIWLQHNSSVVKRYNVSTSLSDVQKCDKSSADSFVAFLVGTSTTKYPIMTSSSPKRYSRQRSHDAGDDDDDDD